MLDNLTLNYLVDESISEPTGHLHQGVDRDPLRREEEGKEGGLQLRSFQTNCGGGCAAHPVLYVGRRALPFRHPRSRHREWDRRGGGGGGHFQGIPGVWTGGGGAAAGRG